MSGGNLPTYYVSINKYLRVHKIQALPSLTLDGVVKSDVLSFIDMSNKKNSHFQSNLTHDTYNNPKSFMSQKSKFLILN